MAEPLPARWPEPALPPALRPVDPEEAALRRRLFRAVAPVALSWPAFAGDAPAVWTPSGEQAIPADAVAIALTLGGAAAWLALPPALAGRLLASADPAPGPRAASPATQALLLELACDAPVAAIEQATGQQIMFVGRGDAASIPGNCLRLGLALSHGDDTDRLVLALGPDAAAEACRLLDPLPVPRGRWRGLPVPLVCTIGEAWLDRGGLRSLRPGDAILPAGPDPAPDRVELVGPDGRRAAARRDGGRLTLLAGFTPAPAIEDAAMPPTARTDAATPPDDALPLDRLDDLPIRLVFEAGRLELPLGRLDEIAPGQVLLLPGDPDAPIAIVANGRRIGTGALVQVGERVGVRVIELDFPEPGHHD